MIENISGNELSLFELDRLGSNPFGPWRAHFLGDHSKLVPELSKTDVLQCENIVRRLGKVGFRKRILLGLSSKRLYLIMFSFLIIYESIILTLGTASYGAQWVIRGSHITRRFVLPLGFILVPRVPLHSLSEISPGSSADIAMNFLCRVADYDKKPNPTVIKHRSSRDSTSSPDIQGNQKELPIPSVEFSYGLLSLVLRDFVTGKTSGVSKSTQYPYNDYLWKYHVSIPFLESFCYSWLKSPSREGFRFKSRILQYSRYGTCSASRYRRELHRK
jgi:hypothetical protein